MVRQLSEVIANLRSITASTSEMADRLQSLPALHDRLEEIEARVKSMDGDVHRMSLAVEAMGAEVVEMRAELEPVGRLAGRMPGRRRERT